MSATYANDVSMPPEWHAPVRRTHEERVLRALRENGGMSRGELAQAVRLSRTTLSEITGNLRRLGAIVVVDTDAAHVFHDEAVDVDVTFAARFNAPVIVDNNTRFAALAEAITSSGAADDLIYLRLSDGVGGGLVVGGRLVIGSVGMAGSSGTSPSRLTGGYAVAATEAAAWRPAHPRSRLP